MKIASVEIENFRGIRQGTIPFFESTLLIGGNNVGKSTVCEALDLVMGPERLNRYPIIDEHDFYQSKYIENDSPIYIRICAIVIGLTKDSLDKFNGNTAFWDHTEKKLLDGANGPEETDKEGVERALVVEFLGYYSQADDEFQGNTYFKYPIKTEEQELDRFTREHKRMCGFLYLRTLRTGSRALSLERGSLLDIILKLREDERTKMWEDTLGSLRKLTPAIHSLSQLTPILQEVNSRVNHFVKLHDIDENLGFFASDLTRENLRKVITFFATSEFDSTLVPFNHLGTGAINTLVFALLTFIAELKKNVIFAMEEPEIALPPHTQRRIIKYVMDMMDQAIFTSHSPYVLEQFEPENVVIVNRTKKGEMTSTPIDLGELKPKFYKSGVRHKFAEALLGRAVLLVEGTTEDSLFLTASEILEREEKEYCSLDMSGASVVSTDSDGNLLKYANFFRGIGIKTYGFFDKQIKKTPKQIAEIHDAFDHSWELPTKGIEEYLWSEIPDTVLKKFVKSVEKRNDFPDNIKERLRKETNLNSKIKDFAMEILIARKGFGYAALLIEKCKASEIPLKIRECLLQIGNDFPMRPLKVKSDEEE